MKSRTVVLGSAVCAALLLLPLRLPIGAAGQVVVHPVSSFSLGPRSGLAGDLANVGLGPGGLSLTSDESFNRLGRRFGAYVSEVRLVQESFNLVRATLDLAPDSSGQVGLEARSSADAIEWSSWSQIAPGMAEPIALPAGRFFQYRLELSAAPGEHPLVRDVVFDLATDGALPNPVTGQNPTVRVLGSREGLVGQRTANGHVIEDRDHFAALPSRRALNPNGKSDYQVKVSYKDRSATVPIWDVGPWNTKDNYWDEKRELFPDLPRFMPEAFAAWMNDYNSGRDQYGRWVSFPASIDLGDGTFIDDLGMKRSDWVDVTFLWVDAASPAPIDLPAFTALKPEPAPAPGSTPSGQTWFFAEGNSQPPFETSFTLLNPNDTDTKATVTFMRKDGSTLKQDLVVKSNARLVVNANEIIPKAEFSTRIDASQPILAERTTYFGKDGHSTTGVGAPRVIWYFADGSSQSPFDTWLLIQNPGTAPANLVLTFYKDNGDEKQVNLAVGPTSRRSVFANEYVPQSTFATRIGADQPIVVERSVYLANGGGSSTTAAPGPAKTWYLADGSTEAGFDTWISLFNASRRPASVTVTYLHEGGSPTQQQLTLDVASRATIHADPDVAGTHFGVKIEADQAIVAERAMYFGGGNDGKGTGAHASVGATDLAQVWYLPDGSTKGSFKEQILVANPGRKPAGLKVDFVKSDGSTLTRQYGLEQMGRLTIDVNAEVPDAQLSARVTSDQPVVVERSSYFDSNGASGGTNSLGIPR